MCSQKTTDKNESEEQKMVQQLWEVYVIGPKGVIELTRFYSTLEEAVKTVKELMLPNNYGSTQYAITVQLINATI